MNHYLYIGHFERDNEFIRFVAESGSIPSVYSPVVQRPIDPAVVEQLISEKGYTVNSIPDSWGIVIKSGYVVWNRFCGEVAAKDFVVQLARKTGCDLADYSSLSFMDVEELVQPTEN